jgi:UDP:flavonoid glycosyltransferase YjiC (YdhE family)
VLPPAATFAQPPWWSDLDGQCPVVLVTQGTVANQDLDHPIAPTIKALAGEDMLLIITTGDEVSAAELAATAHRMWGSPRSCPMTSYSTRLT